MSSVKDPAYKIPSLAFGLIVKVLTSSCAVFTNVITLPIEIAGKVKTTPSVLDVNVIPAASSGAVTVWLADLFSRLNPVTVAWLNLPWSTGPLNRVVAMIYSPSCYE